MKIIITEEQYNSILKDIKTHKFIYHGTSKGAALNIQRKGSMTPNNTGEEQPSISFTEHLNYAKHYANMKGGRDKMVIIRTQLNNQFKLSNKIRQNKGHEYVTFNEIPLSELEIMSSDNTWHPMSNWNVIFNEPL